MAKVTILLGLVLVVLGGGLFVASGAVTSLIPVGFGLPLLVLGAAAAAGGDAVRMHTMHVAVIVTLLGAVGAGIMGIKGLGPAMSGAEDARPLAVAGQLVMAAICILHVILSVWSFITARRNSQQAK